MSEKTKDGRARAPFLEALASALARRGVSLDEFCRADDAVARRVLEEYGAMFVAEGVRVPSVCVFESAEEVERFQREAGWRAEDLDGATVELQPAAMEALVGAREEARGLGLHITPRGGSEAGRRSFEDSLRLWRSRCDPALEHWCARGRLAIEEAERVRGLPLGEQVSAVLELERGGLFFSKDFSKSILRSVAAPGASQHLAMLAFDAAEFADARVRSLLARHGWFQTVLSDLPHFTYLGLDESDLPSRGLRRVESGGQAFWIPEIVNCEL
ncbi:MAG: hypothetical protein DMF67_03415 [Acidobacteria bacterium]|nr:MAG: hypothetical protein DMF67_03415 [Acidobacteriota bacterium]